MNKKLFSTFFSAQANWPTHKISDFTDPPFMFLATLVALHFTPVSESVTKVGIELLGQLKKMKGGSEKSEILCVGQLACAEKKIENSNFNRRPLHRANISQMFL